MINNEFQNKFSLQLFVHSYSGRALVIDLNLEVLLKIVLRDTLTLIIANSHKLCKLIIATILEGITKKVSNY